MMSCDGTKPPITSGGGGGGLQWPNKTLICSCRICCPSLFETVRIPVIAIRNGGRFRSDPAAPFPFRHRRFGIAASVRQIMAPSRGRRRSKGVGVRRAPCSPSVPKAAALGRPHLLRPLAEEGLVRPALARRESTPSSPLEPPRPKVLLTGAPHLAQTRASRSLPP